MKFVICNRWTAAAQFEAEIQCGEDAPLGVKVGLAVRWARESGADLRGADLRGAVLSGAVLSGADLRGAVLRGAVLRGALRAGQIDGSVYAGECACLVGTIAKVKGVDVDEMDRDVSHPAEQWFLMIRPGDKPGDDTAGGFAIGKALEWTLEWCALSGVNPDAPTASSIAA